VAFPLAVSCTNPTARRPPGFFLAFSCGGSGGVFAWAMLNSTVETAIAKMTASPTVRYKDLLDSGVLTIHSLDASFPENGSRKRNFKDEIPMNFHDKAPDFTLQDENGKEVSLKGLRGKVVVLFFYPRADTPGCTIEACEFRDSYKKIQKTGAVLLGISPDTPQAQKKFQEKFGLPFPLLADADKKIADAFGVLQGKKMYGKKVMGIVRSTFIIGPEGTIQHIFPKVKPEGHAEEVLAYLKGSAKGAA
jgi:thioredoxin-dependent peroxiredoxin